MADLENFDCNGPGNPQNNIFGLPFSQNDSGVVILPVPWEVTASYGAGTSRSIEPVFKASLQIDLFNIDTPDNWKQGFYMKNIDKKILMKSDYLRKEAELFLDYTCRGDDIGKNNFMCKSLREINEGSEWLNAWVEEQTTNLLGEEKLVLLLGGEHSISFGFIKALSKKHSDFGILQIDAHCDLRKSYEDFVYSHASVMYNVLNEIPEVTKLVQLGVRDFCKDEWEYIQNNKERITTFFDRDIKEQMYAGETWKNIVEEIINRLPQKVYISYDIDGLDPKLCPNTGTPVQGGFEAPQMNYLIKKIVQSGRTIIGADLVEIGNGDVATDANVGARIVWQLCNWLVESNSEKKQIRP
ncbi:MAG: agmatinase family protein [Chitinophagaceae bacterium]|jgi:agmatinase|nr:agmatinase family protein [Chitinophagaceae bacterium]